MKENKKKRTSANRIKMVTKLGTPAEVLLNGIRYFVNAYDHSLNTTLLEFEIIFALANNASSIGDLSMANFKAKTQPLADFMTWQPGSAECRTVSVLQDASMYTGCLSVIGSGFCTAAAATSGGATAIFCEGIWNYTLSFGAADCFTGIAGVIAKQLGSEASLQALQLIAGIGNPKLLDVLEQATGIMCQDVKDNHTAP